MTEKAEKNAGLDILLGRHILHFCCFLAEETLIRPGIRLKSSFNILKFC